jgi:hypothetical protein
LIGDLETSQAAEKAVSGWWSGDMAELGGVDVEVD